MLGGESAGWKKKKISVIKERRDCDGKLARVGVWVEEDGGDGLRKNKYAGEQKEANTPEKGKREREEKGAEERGQ